MMTKILFTSPTTKDEKILELQKRISQTEERIKEGQLSNDREYVYAQLSILEVYKAQLDEYNRSK